MRRRSVIIIIIIIIINEKINVAFSRRTARTRNSHKKIKAAKTSCLTVRKKKNSHENDCSKSSVFSCPLNISNDGCDVSVTGKLYTRAPATAKARSPRVRRRVVGTSRADDEPERSLHRDSTSAAQLKATAR